MKRKLYAFLFFLLLVWLLKKPLMNWYAKRQTGLQAAQDASQMTSYTTYNTSLYSPPVWQPVLSFFKANAYVPVGQGKQDATNQVDYSLQG